LRPVPAAKRQWKTPNRKTKFIVPRGFDEDPDMHSADRDILRLMTTRSDDQFNTTIYTLDDRFRGVFGTRRVLLMNNAEMVRLGIATGDRVTVSTVASDNVPRSIEGLRRRILP
jgi:anaerobic selenocysteine-containing dehydrogenase